MKKIIPLILILTVLALISGDWYYTKNNLDNAKLKAIDKFELEIATTKSELSKFFELNYQIMRSIVMLESVQGFSNKKTFKKTNGNIIAQQFFNQLALVNRISELYLVPINILETNSVKEAKLQMFDYDEIKLSKTEGITLEDVSHHLNDKFEIEEVKEHLLYFQRRYSKRAKIKKLNYPLICGNMKLLLGNVDTMTKNLFVCSMPFYNVKGILGGTTSIIIQSNAINKFFKNKHIVISKEVSEINLDNKENSLMLIKKIDLHTENIWYLTYSILNKNLNKMALIVDTKRQNKIFHFFVILLVFFILIIFIFQSDNKLLSKLNSQLNNEIRTRKESELRLEQFTSDAGHEIRSPIGVIKTEAELSLRNERDVTYYKNSLKNILKMGDRLEKIVKNLLVLAKSKEGFQPNYKIINISSLLRLFYQNYKLIYPKSNLVVDFKINDKLDLMIDEEQFEQVFINLLSNSEKYSEGKCHMTISVDDVHNSSKILINFKDNGIGIPEDKVNFIKDRFYRVDEVRTIGKEGLGLGLSICKKILDAHDATFEIKNNIGEKGITVTLGFSKINYE